MCCDARPDEPARDRPVRPFRLGADHPYLVLLGDDQPSDAEGSPDGDEGTERRSTERDDPDT